MDPKQLGFVIYLVLHMHQFQKYHLLRGDNTHKFQCRYIWTLPAFKSCSILLSSEVLILCSQSLSNLYFFQRETIIKLISTFHHKPTSLSLCPQETCNWIINLSCTTCLSVKGVLHKGAFIVNLSIVDRGWIQQFSIEIINNKARLNLINVKYCQMAFRLARWRCSWEFFGNPLVKRK